MLGMTVETGRTRREEVTGESVVVGEFVLGMLSMFGVASGKEFS